MNVREVLPRDAIPSIDAPSFGTTYFGSEDDDVLVVEDDPPRAYPVRILSYHEIVNDVLEGENSLKGSNGEPRVDRRAIAVTWCPICASGVVYDRRVEGTDLTFGTSGKLADDALVMYDRETGSEWKQPLGRAFEGSHRGAELAVVPASMMSWKRFRSTYPDGIVLQPVRGDENDSRRQPPRDVYDMTPYDQYERSNAFGLRAMRGEGDERSWDRADIDAKTTVLGIVHDGDAVGYPAPQVHAEGGVVTDTLGGLNLVVIGSGRNLHAFENPGYGFEIRDGTVYADGVSWDPVTGRGSDGRRLRPVPSRRLYAFAWQDDHGRDSFYGLDDAT
jgi:hypothetical protein